MTAKVTATVIIMCFMIKTPLNKNGADEGVSVSNALPLPPQNQPHTFKGDL
jgi:hypothetical protein